MVRQCCDFLGAASASASAAVSSISRDSSSAIGTGPSFEAKMQSVP